MLFLSSYRCRGLPLAAMLSLSLIPSFAQAQGRAREVGSLQVGTTLLWVRATDQGVVELFSAQGYRNMFTKPIMLLPEKVARFAYAVDHATAAVPDTVHPVTIEAGNLGDSTLRVRSTLGGPAPNLLLDFTADPTMGKVVLKGDQAGQLLTTLADAAQATREMSHPVAEPAVTAQVATPAPAVVPAPSVPTPVTAPVAVASAPAPTAMPVSSVEPDAPSPQVPAPAVIAKVAGAPIAAHRPMVATIPVVAAPTLPALPALDTLTKAPVVVASAAPSVGSVATKTPPMAAAPAAPTSKRSATPPPRARALQPTPAAAPPAPPPLIITPKPIAPSARVAMQQAKAAAHDSATVAALVAAHEDELAECYRQFGLRYNPDLAGPLALGIEASDSGTVTGVRVVHRSWDGPAPADVEQCVRTNVRGWRFTPAAADTIALTLRFTP